MSAPMGLRLHRLRRELFGSQLRRNVVARGSNNRGEPIGSRPLLPDLSPVPWVRAIWVVAGALDCSRGCSTRKPWDRQAITKYVAEEHGRGDQQAIESYSATATAILVGVGTAIVALALAVQGPVIKLFRLAPQSAEQMHSLFPGIAVLSGYVIVVQKLGRPASLPALARWDAQMSSKSLAA